MLRRVLFNDSKHTVVFNMFNVILVALLFRAVSSYDKIFMGHATNQPGYNFVCHQRTVFNTLGGEIFSSKQFYESDLKDCNILLTSPPGTLIDFRFTDIDIIASNLDTCFDASLRIYDGSTNTTSLLLGFPNGICGQQVPSFHIRSTTNTMLLQLHITSPYTSSFGAVYTAYSPRTSVLCFYCDDLCLPDKSQLCDGFENCRDGEDEKLNSCNDQPAPIPKPNNDEDVKLIVIFVLGGMAFIFLVIIIAILVKKKLAKYCIEKRRRRRAAAAANLMLHPPLTPHMYPPRMGSNRTRADNLGVPPVGLGYNRPFMAGPTIPNQARAAGTRQPRSNMPPPYTSVAQNTADVNPNAYSDNPTLVMDDEPRPHISDGEDTPPRTTNTVFNYNQPIRNYDTNEDNQNQETSFIEEPMPSQTVQNLPITTDNNIPNTDRQTVSPNNADTLTSNASVADNDSDVISLVPEVSDSVTDVTNPVTDVTDISTDVTVAQPVNEIDNVAVDVSTRDTIYVIEDLDLGLGNQQEEETGSGEVIYI
ncbi:uncharacterized protein [Amphiura filiformis]|uniref:uncharacterized protein n=1 Tax=Amphiura filiformis TaxID=82378 RepID=UPI003B221B87